MTGIIGGENVEIVRRRGGWFVTGESWSGPWANQDAAELARKGDYEAARRAEAPARIVPV